MKNLKFKYNHDNQTSSWTREYHDNWFWTSEMLFALGLGLLIGLSLALSI